MAIISILVTNSPFDTQSAYSAYRFATAVCESEHTLKGVFFYQAGVNNSNAFQQGHSDELNMYQKWQSLAAQFNIPLQVCVTAANRRGIINSDDASEFDTPHFNLQSPFEEVGLGDLISLMHDADRTVQF